MDAVHTKSPNVQVFLTITGSMQENARRLYNLHNSQSLNAREYAEKLAAGLINNSFLPADRHVRMPTEERGGDGCVGNFNPANHILVSLNKKASEREEGNKMYRRLHCVLCHARSSTKCSCDVTVCGACFSKHISCTMLQAMQCTQ